MRYRLDELGWFQFEGLIQSLLKAELGLGVQSWGGSGDLGRDAYFPGTLAFPSKNSNEAGPFVFQVKFAANANAAGADASAKVLSAVQGERSRIERRISKETWESPRHYAFITNAPLSSSLRTKICASLSSVLDPSRIHPLGGNDVCDLLDQHPSLRQSFPQLLGIRDLKALLRESVSQEILQRSQAALDGAGEIAPVFVPTRAYSETWRILNRSNFAVLEGPPEVGKTAIAWMIAIALSLQDWEALVVGSPEDFFGLYQRGNRQVFVADDAFGRTEYDPARGRKWEYDLKKVLSRVDQHHWLIWTSRKHILERALHNLDTQVDRSEFPKPGAVIVDAARLTIREKALILYRHCRFQGLDERAKQFVRTHARMIVHNPTFTPERIRLFVSQTLSELLDRENSRDLSVAELRKEVTNAIARPTVRMRKTFKSLPVSHKLALISMLESEENQKTKIRDKDIPF